MYKFSIVRLQLNDGSTFEPGQLTILVGPNNTGKSRFLKDIVHLISGQGAHPILVPDLSVTTPHSLNELLEHYPYLERRKLNDNDTTRGIWMAPNLCSAGGHSCNHIWPADFDACLASSNRANAESFFRKHFGSGLLSHLTTEHRLQLVKEAPTQGARGQANNLAQELYMSGLPTEMAIQKHVAEAFDQEIALDFSEPGIMRFRVSNNFKNVPKDPREAYHLLQKYEQVDVQGDGFRSFVGMIVAVECASRPLMVIDEPEAFLHPPQAYRIGEYLGLAARKGIQVFVATHSAEVVKGLLASNPTAGILRIDRIGNSNKFSSLDTNVVSELMTDPLLSSIRVIDGLFYTAAVVVEADADARFYQAVAAKLAGRDEVYFVNADNKQTVPRVLEAYRRAGIPSAGIVDFDALNSDSVLKKLAESAGLPEVSVLEVLKARETIGRFAGEQPASDRLRSAQHRLELVMGEILAILSSLDRDPKQDGSAIEGKLSQIRNRIQESADATKLWSELKRNGSGALSSEMKLQFDTLYKTLTASGMFVNPIGELESMLIDQGIDPTSDKRAWILRALQLLRSLQVERDKYPWRFISDVLEYFRAARERSACAEKPSYEIPLPRNQITSLPTSSSMSAFTSNARIDTRCK